KQPGDYSQPGVRSRRSWAGGAATASAAAGDRSDRGVCGTGQLRNASDHELPAEHAGPTVHRRRVVRGGSAEEHLWGAGEYVGRGLSRSLTVAARKEVIESRPFSAD